jgi:hypothetical protein
MIAEAITGWDVLMALMFCASGCFFLWCLSKENK